MRNFKLSPAYRRRHNVELQAQDFKLDNRVLHSASTDEHLRDLDRLCRKAPDGAIVECGVLRGGTAAVLINASKGRKVYLCDTFEGYPIPGPKDTNVRNRRLFVRGFCRYPIAKVLGYLKMLKLPLSQVEFVKGEFKDTLPELAKRIGPIAFWNFDGDWYESVMTAFPHLLPNLTEGGILVIHDYPKFPGEVEAVEKFINPKEIEILNEGAVYYVKR